MRSYLGLRVLADDSPRSFEDILQVVTASVGCESDDVDLFVLEEVPGTEFDNLTLDDELYCMVPMDSEIYTVEGVARGLAGLTQESDPISSFVVSHLSPSVGDVPSLTSQIEPDAQIDEVRNAMTLLSLCERYNSKAENMKVMADMVISQLINMQLHVEAGILSVRTAFKAADVSMCLNKLDVEAPFSAAKRAENQQQLGKLIEAELWEYRDLMSRLETYKKRLLPD